MAGRLLSKRMRYHEFSSHNLFRLPAPPTYATAERELYRPEPLRVEITAFAPTLASAVRLALLKRAWQQWRARGGGKVKSAKRTILEVDNET